eukprot:992048-Ditylum_brightwellii.AAC.1
MATTVATSFHSCADPGVALYGALADAWSCSKKTSEIGFEKEDPASWDNLGGRSADSLIWGVMLATYTGIKDGALEVDVG